MLNKLIHKKILFIVTFLFSGIAIAIPVFAADSGSRCYLDFVGDSSSYNARAYIDLTGDANIPDKSAITTEIYYDSSKLDVGHVSNISNSSIASVTVLPGENKIIIATPTIGSLNNSKTLLAEIPLTAKNGGDINDISNLVRITSQKVAVASSDGSVITTLSSLGPSQINGSPVNDSPGNENGSSSSSGSDGNKYDYTPMEKIPGTTEDISAFPDYIKAIYKFALWSVGIAALLMISVGGFMYFTAAGNTSKLDKAKTVIRDSIFGLMAVLLAYLILYVINPDLVNVSLESFSK